MKTRRRAFSLVELLTVIGIIGLLIGFLMPAINEAVKRAREARVKQYLMSITIGLEEFRKDMGYYPDSSIRTYGTSGTFGGNGVYLRTRAQTGYPKSSKFTDIGAHRLAEAMFGLDKLGFSTAPSPIPGIPHYAVDAMGRPCYADADETPMKRMGPYVAIQNLPIGTIENCHAIQNLPDYNPTLYQRLADLSADPPEFNDNPLIMDGIGQHPRPILYFKANTRGSLIHEIYDYRDNYYLTHAFGITSCTFVNGKFPSDNNYCLPTDYPSYTPLSPYWKIFQYFVWDQRTGIPQQANESDKLQSPYARPYNADSFILWSAGVDGEYGTTDDIVNFDRAK